MSTTLRTPPEILYHYTDSTGLLGILGSPLSLPGTEGSPFGFEKGASFGTLWATDARYLNDAHELTYGATSLAEKLERHAEESRTSEVVARLRELAETVRDGRFELTYGTDTERTLPHVTCFCESGDLLSQWRGYGGGYAIGFDREVFRKFAVLDTELYKRTPDLAMTTLQEPVHVKYGPTDSDVFLEECAAELAQNLEDVAAGKEDYEWPNVFRAVCARWLAEVKHGAFEEEVEWRLIHRHTQNSDTHFRVGGVGLVPYVRLHFPLALGGRPTIREIVIGPGGERELRRESLERLLHSIGSPGTIIRLSDAPFRG